MKDSLPRQTVDSGRAPPAAVRLTVVEGPSVGQEFKIDGAATIGRAPEATVLVDDLGVSRLHARLSRDEDGQHRLEDLESKNGTFLNGARITAPAPVNAGDRIRIGPRVVLAISTYDRVEEHIVQRQRLETVGRLGAGIAHDLNNVLAAVHAGTSFLSQLSADTPLGDERVQECLRDLALASQQGGELTRGILRFLRGKRSLREALDVAELVNDVARLLRHTIDHSIRIETQLESRVVVHGNHAELQQVLLNLCLNARDAMPSGGTLRITAGLREPPPELGFPAERKVAELQVTDSGTGIDPATQARVFEPFFTTKREGAGYGIGLATVREIVKLHGGRITLESELNRGTTFKVFLTAVDVQTFATTGERPPPHPTWHLDRSVSVLLVDDEQLLRRSFGRLLRQAGFQVTEAPGGHEALELYAEHRHDIVILDLDMPRLSGEETQRMLRERHPDVCVVFASGHADPAREAAVLAAGARAFLQKPYDVDRLVSTIRAALEQQQFRPPERTRV